MQALRADLSTFSAIRSAGAASSDRSRPTRASTTTPATFSGSAAPHSAAGPMFSMRWAALTPTFSPTWRRSTSAGACSWPVTGYGSCRRAGFTTSAAVRSRPIRRPKSSTTTAIIWRCSTSALRPCSGSRLPSCVLRSTCWRPCPIWCRGGATISGRWFRAYRDFLRWHRDLSRKRKTIRQNRKGSAEEKIYRGSVVLRYLLGRRTFGRMM